MFFFSLKAAYLVMAALVIDDRRTAE